MASKLIVLLLTVSFLAIPFRAQETVPEPGPPRRITVPEVAESALPNGLKIAVSERKNVPLITVRLLINSGAMLEPENRAGLADLTAALTTKHTRTRNADQIAEQFEFLGGTLTAGADWNKTIFTFTVASDKFDAAMAILGDVIINATSDANELKLLKAQALDNLAADLKEPSYLASYVASKYVFDEHPPGGTPASIKAITRADIVAYRNRHYRPNNAVLIFTGDISASKAKAAAQKTFGRWLKRPEPKISTVLMAATQFSEKKRQRMLIVDLPDSGQTAVSYTLRLKSGGRVTCTLPTQCESSKFFRVASVLNSVLGGGYSSRLNQEIRIKRGLSYGAGSGFQWRGWSSNFATRTQTKDPSAAEVAEIVANEIQRLGNEAVLPSELEPRKLVITGDFGREFETTADFSETLSAIYNYGLGPAELKSFVDDINSVTPEEIRYFAKEILRDGEFVIVGDYSKFRDDLAKRFPDTEIRVIEAAKLDLSKPNLK